MKNIFIHPSLSHIYQQYPLTLIDVGASGGIQDVWKNARAHLRVVGFEPDSRAFKQLTQTADPQCTFINTALYNKDGEVTFHLTKKQMCSSIFEPNFSFLEQFPDADRHTIINSIPVAVRKLSKKLLESEHITDADFLKVDTQGEDLFVLEGAQDVLDELIFGINIEAEFSPLYLKQPLFSDIDIYLRSRGFQLFDMKRYYWKRKIAPEASNTKGQLAFADVLYLKTYAALRDSLKNKNAEYQRSKILKCISICQLYGKTDYGLHLAAQAHKDGFLNDSDHTTITGSLSPKPFRLTFHGQYSLARLFHRIYLYLKSNRHYFSDEELGNEE